MVYTLRFSLFNVFGFCIIHILYTECAEIKKKLFRRRKVRTEVSFLWTIKGSPPPPSHLPRICFHGLVLSRAQGLHFPLNRWRARLEGLNWFGVWSTVGVCEVSTNLFLCPVSALLFISILVKPLFLGDGRITLKLTLGKQVVSL